jgi:hypothetical protein
MSNSRGTMSGQYTPLPRPLPRTGSPCERRGCRIPGVVSELAQLLAKHSYIDNQPWQQVLEQPTHLEHFG